MRTRRPRDRDQQNELRDRLADLPPRLHAERALDALHHVEPGEVGLELLVRRDASPLGRAPPPRRSPSSRRASGPGSRPTSRRRRSANCIAAAWLGCAIASPMSWITEVIAVAPRDTVTCSRITAASIPAHAERSADFATWPFSRASLMRRGVGCSVFCDLSGGTDQAPVELSGRAARPRRAPGCRAPVKSGGARSRPPRVRSRRAAGRRA